MYIDQLEAKLVNLIDFIVKTGETAQQTAEAPSIVGMVVPFVLIFFIFYFLLIRPQKKQQKKHEEMINSLKKDDEIITSSGILGKIFAVEDKFYVIDIAEKTRIKILKSQIAGKYENK